MGKSCFVLSLSNFRDCIVRTTNLDLFYSWFDLIPNVQVRGKPFREHNVLTFKNLHTFWPKAPNTHTLSHTHRAPSRTPHHSIIRKAPSKAATSDVCCITAGGKQPIIRKLAAMTLEAIRVKDQ